MQVKETPFDGLFEIFPTIYSDNRGHFFESFHESNFKDMGLPYRFVQDNQSFSQKGVVRGLHFQHYPFEQGKLVRVLHGMAKDVVVDIRPNSPTFGQHYTCILDGSKGNMLYVPGGFAHGLAALEDTWFFYKCTANYNQEAEDGILWSDPVLAIDWGVDQPILSEKDKLLPTFDQIREKIS